MTTRSDRACEPKQNQGCGRDVAWALALPRQAFTVGPFASDGKSGEQRLPRFVCRGGPTGKVPSVRAEPDCIFCGIVVGAISSTTIAQSDEAIAFMDINPVTPGHALVVPRAHATDLFDITGDDLAACARVAQQIAGRAKDRLAADGVNLLVCSGEAAFQTVLHFHIHVIPRFKDEPGKDRIGLPWHSVPGNPDEIKRIGNLLT